MNFDFLERLNTGQFLLIWVLVLAIILCLIVAVLRLVSVIVHHESMRISDTEAIEIEDAHAQLEEQDAFESVFRNI